MAMAMATIVSWAPTHPTIPKDSRAAKSNPSAQKLGPANTKTKTGNHRRIIGIRISILDPPETTPLLHSNSTRRLRRRRRRPSAQFAFGLAGQVFHVPVPSKHPRHSSDQQETT